MPTAVWILIVIAASIAGLVAGTLLAAWRARRAALAQRRIPERWPLSPRVIVNSEERRVWRWLSRAFFDHQIMIKMPVTRFTMPRSPDNSVHWFNLLNGAYCTFTVCTAEGRVVGCVDVPGPAGLSRRNQHLKHSLLTQCGIAYWLVRSANLPTMAEIRLEFLGEDAAFADDHAHDQAAIAAAQQHLRSAIDRQRHSRHSDLAPLAPAQGPAPTAGRAAYAPDLGFAGESGGSEFGSSFHGENSFIAPLDSRSGELR